MEFKEASPPHYHRQPARKLWRLERMARGQWEQRVCFNEQRRIVACVGDGPLAIQPGASSTPLFVRHAVADEHALPCGGGILRGVAVVARVPRPSVACLIAPLLRRAPVTISAAYEALSNNPSIPPSNLFTAFFAVTRADAVFATAAGQINSLGPGEQLGRKRANVSSAASKTAILGHN